MSDEEEVETEAGVEDVDDEVVGVKSGDVSAVLLLLLLVLRLPLLLLAVLLPFAG